MEERARSCLLRSRPNLEADIKAAYLMDHMISDGVLTNDEEERVLQKVSRLNLCVCVCESVCLCVCMFCLYKCECVSNDMMAC